VTNLGVNKTGSAVRGAAANQTKRQLQSPVGVQIENQVESQEKGNPVTNAEAIVK